MVEIWGRGGDEGWVSRVCWRRNMRFVWISDISARERYLEGGFQSEVVRVGEVAAGNLFGENDFGIYASKERSAVVREGAARLSIEYVVETFALELPC